MKKIIHDTLILFAFTLVIGALLGLVYMVTKAPIEAAAKEKAQQAYQAVFDSADSFEALEGFDKAAATDLVKGDGFEDQIDDVQVAKDGAGDTLGYVITVTAKDGSQGDITFSVGIQNDGTVNGYSITNTSETPGLGIKASDESFMAFFENKLVDAFTVVKQPVSADGEVEAISGATITSKAIANGCNAALDYFSKNLKGVN